MVAFAPFFSSTALPLRTKAVFVGVMAWLLAPLVAALPRAQVSISFSALIGELAVGLVYGLTLTLLTETMLFAGQVLGAQFSFSAVNLMDPTSNIQTPLLGDLLQLMGTLVVISAGLDRILLASMVRSFRVVPLGSYALPPNTALEIVRAAGGIFLAAVELAAPVLAATMLVEVAVSLLGKLSPQLPVMARFTGWGANRCRERRQNRHPSIVANRLAKTATFCTAASFRPPPVPWLGSWFWVRWAARF